MNKKFIMGSSKNSFFNFILKIIRLVGKMKNCLKVSSSMKDKRNLFVQWKFFTFYKRRALCFYRAKLHYFREALILILLFTTAIISAQTDSSSGKVKRTIAIMPSYYMNYDKEFEFLGVLIRDSIKAKLEIRNTFNISSVDLLYSAIDKLKLTSKDYINKDKVKEVAYLTGSDIAIQTKFSVSNKKIMIVCEAFDVLNPQTVITSTINGVVGPDIFDSVDKIAIDISDKMNNTFQPIDAEKLKAIKVKSTEFEQEVEKQVIETQKIEIENKKIENIITQSSSLEEVLKLKYSGISLGTKYEMAEMLVKGSNFDRKFIKKKEGNTIVFKGSLNSIFASQETILNFKENILADIWILACETTETQYDNDLKNFVTLLRKDLGKETEDSKYFTWNDSKVFIELTDVKTKNGRTFIFIHSYLNGQSIPIDKIINYPEYQVFTKAFNFSVGFGTSISTFTKWARYFAFKKKSQSSPISPDDFTTSYDHNDSSAAFLSMKVNLALPIGFDFYSNRISSGILIEPSYSSNMSNQINGNDSEERNDSPFYVHSVNLNLSGRNKFNFKTIGNSFIFEYGLLTSFDYLQFNDKTQYIFSDSWNENGTSYIYDLFISNIYISAGPMLNFMFEFQNKSYSHQVGFYIAGYFGVGLMKISNNILTSFNANLLFGINYRFSYYNLKILK